MFWTIRRMYIVLALVLTILIVHSIRDNFDKEYQLTEKDKIEIIYAVNQYYYSISTKDFYKALQYCNLEDSKIDIQTNVIALQEIWDGIIEEFELEYKPIKVDKYKSNDKTEFVVKVSINLKYRNTLGGSVGEIAYVEKVNDVWKIYKIRGLDRYGIYRVGEYQYERLIDFLTVNNT